MLEAEHWRGNKEPMHKAEAHLKLCTLNARVLLRLSHFELTVEKVVLIVSGAVKGQRMLRNCYTKAERDTSPS